MRAKSHDQRKGQWLINKIRNEFPYSFYDGLSTIEEISNKEKRAIEIKLWNMENAEFDKLMGDYND